MTPAIQGRHCAACAKTVVDFSRMTDAQVVAYLSRANDRSCGRFRQEQLSRPLRVTLAAPVSKRWAAATLAVLGLGAAAPALAQLPIPQTLRQQVITMGIVATRPQPVLPVRVVQGRVTDAGTGQGLPAVTVLMEGTQHGTSTRSDGTYELEVAAGTNNTRLVFSSIGFKTVVKPSDQAEAVVLEASCDRLMGEVIVTYGSRWYTPRGLWQRLTRPFRR
ncbi:CarboxypepD_reg-like domain-containing protein [Hymenobacter psychrophilus]|uniref:CarboxypepD_reg-like domain-containing protein n=2 Tax=Hymenobacter psychrophilus TaxID=651662 RepID=A0A1H3IKM5_9BACT|nr:CarboxypepD_reg-like domain-containing protein [Hymenobacter psychrophilus]